MSDLSLGIDLGTSGIRSAVVDRDGKLIAQARAEYDAQNPEKIDANSWWNGVERCLNAQMVRLNSLGIDPNGIARIAVDATSGSMVLTDAALSPVTRALMYNSGGFTAEAAAIARYAPDPHITRGTGSALARMLRLQSENSDHRAVHMLHQADFIMAKLIGHGGVSDHSNALKSGFDPEGETWPLWASAAGVREELLPKVSAAGSKVELISPVLADHFGLSRSVMIHAGTTDSIAAFLACAPLQSGSAVTSLGTTLAVKLLSPTRIDAPELGLYSHRLGDHWLVGGASNTGGGVLRHFFSAEQLQSLSEQIDPDTPSPLEYYPLLVPGERFPINDPNLEPRMSPRPDCDVEFLHGLLESIARIEAQSYRAMQALGACYPAGIFTAGGGGANAVWTQIRKRVLGVEIETPEVTEAAYGVALLARANR